MIRASIVVLCALLLAAGDGKPDPKWLDGRVPAKVRKAMESLVGQPLPQPPDSVKWVGGEAPTLGPGRAIVLQVIGASGGRSTLEKMRKALPEEVLLVGVHSGKKVDRVAKDFEEKGPCPVALDGDGVWAAALDLPETPVNLVVDESGKVRFVGLRSESLKAAVASMSQPQAADPAGSQPGERPMAGVMVDFPVPSGKIDAATDRRGQRMPDFNVEQWITDRPATPDRKLFVLDFWATWCGPCVASIPHMNDLATKFADIAQCVGISDEQQADFAKGMAKIRKTPQDFRYALALAPSRGLYGFFGIQGIPHCVIVSSDGVVRWQGHPATLSEDLFRQFAEAQRALNGSKPAATEAKPGGGTPRKY
jgi:thiol-disulfide isomerase/thioredoxin